MALARIGLPLLRESTYREFMSQLSSLESDKARDFFSGLYETILLSDQLYAKFIRDTSSLYPEDDKGVAWAELVAGYTLLSKEGELPKLLDDDKFKSRWDATMNRSLCIMNVGANMDIIRADNPIFWETIMNSTRYFMGRDERMAIMSDLSSGYMFLADNVRR